MIRVTASFLLSLALASPLPAQEGAKINSRDVVDIIAMTLEFASKDSVLVRPTQGIVLVDVELSRSLVRSKSRSLLDPAVEAKPAIPSSLVGAKFFDYWKCPSAAISVRCEMTCEGAFLMVYAVETRGTGDELVVWVAVSTRPSRTGAHVHSVARAITFRRLETGEWRFVRAGDYLAS